MLYSKRNYLIIALSVVLIVLGFILMSGGGSTNPEEFNPAIFSSRRVVVAPIVCLVGFGLMIYGIMTQSTKK